MNAHADFALRTALLRPETLAGASVTELAQVIAQGRLSRLLPSLGARLTDAGMMDALPAAAARHLRSALLVHEKQKRDLSYDCECLRRALSEVDIGFVLLKGGAYMQSRLEVGRGRLITDIDIIVPEEKIPAAEKALNRAGWETSQLDPYNESYYRRWSHETPALVNPRRGTTLDLHHNILPPTAAPNINAALLFESIREARPGVYTLSLQDMVIHSATHLFHEGEFHHGLRDVWDLDRMLREFPERDPEFWSGLVARARQLELRRPLFHGLRYAQMIFETPVPRAVAQEAGDWLMQLRRPIMDLLFLRAFRPRHSDCRLALTGTALNLLYLRSHYLRMPLYLLLPHLVRKAWMRRQAAGGEIPDGA